MPSSSSPVDRPRITKPASSAGGPVYEYRGAVIHSNEKGTNHAFTLDGFFHGPRGYWGGLGHIDVVVGLADTWLDTGRLPSPYVHKR